MRILIRIEAQLLIIATLLASPAYASDMGPGGLGMSHAFTAQGAYITGDRLGGDGFGLLARVEGLVLPQETPLGNRAGFSLFAEVGYESYDADTDDFAAGPMAFDMAVGFPVTLFSFGGGDSIGLQAMIGPGFGIGVNHAYAFAQGRVGATILPGTLEVEAVYQWTPMEASYAWDEDTGLDIAHARGAAYITLDGTTFSVFAEITQADIETYTPGQDTGPLYERADPLLPPSRAEYGRTFEFGVGVVF